MAASKTTKTRLRQIGANGWLVRYSLCLHCRHGFQEMRCSRRQRLDVHDFGEVRAGWGFAFLDQAKLTEVMHHVRDLLHVGAVQTEASKPVRPLVECGDPLL